MSGAHESASHQHDILSLRGAVEYWMQGILHKCLTASTFGTSEPVSGVRPLEEVLCMHVFMTLHQHDTIKVHSDHFQLIMRMYACHSKLSVRSLM